MENQTLEQNVADALGMNTETQTETVQQTGDSTATETTETTETTVETTQPEQTNTTQTETNGMKQLRTQYESTRDELNHKEQLLQRVAESMGIKVEDVEKKLQEEEDKKRANTNNIPIEIQRQIREQDEKIKQLEMQNLRANYDARLAKLRAEHTMTDNQVVEFAEQAKAAGFNIFTPGLDLNLLYRAMNYDTIVGDLKNQIRQEVLKEMQQGNNANTVSNRTNKPADQKTELSGKDFMEELFNQFR